ncbi:hypothetical protein B0H13DRAFT_2303936 [Mycena leptocephala]|nr:hypothetical protein B0H13DRAFT_2303936 [Mycena leptocephala]
MIVILKYIAPDVSPGHFGQPSPPSNFELIDKELRAQCGIPSIPCKSVQGNVSFMNDPRTIIAKLSSGDWANSATRKLIRFHPEIPEDGVIREFCHAQKWRKNMDLDILSPMYDAGAKHYYVNEGRPAYHPDSYLPSFGVFSATHALAIAAAVPHLYPGSHAGFWARFRRECVIFPRSFHWKICECPLAMGPWCQIRFLRHGCASRTPTIQGLCLEGFLRSLPAQAIRVFLFPTIFGSFTYVNLSAPIYTGIGHA